MSEAITKLNIELGLFVKELLFYIENTNEIDEKTQKLLIDAVLAINVLHTNGKLHETASIDQNDSDFLDQLDNVQFESRRYIMCCLCHEQIPLSRADFEAHTEKPLHKVKLSELRARGGTLPAKKNSQLKPMVITSTETKQPIQNGVTNDVSSVTQSSLNSSSDRHSVRSMPMNENISASKQTKVNEPKLEKNSLHDSSSSVNTRETIEKQGITNSIMIEIETLKTRTAERISDEKNIIEALKQGLRSLDKNLVFTRIGSTTYGFGSADINFNIAIDTSGKSQQQTSTLFTSLKGLLTGDILKSKVRDVTKLPGYRVMSHQWKFVHNNSGIECLLLLDDGNFVKSTNLIRDFIKLNPICGTMIFFIRAWQNVLKNISQDVFCFNTYTISVLVIFFLQTKNILPKPHELKDTLEKMQAAEQEQLETSVWNMLIDFFEFYATQFELHKNVVDVRTGRLEGQQKFRDSYKNNKASWTNCTMYVHDLLRPINITAEVSKKDATSFQNLCMVFAKELKKTQKVPAQLQLNLEPSIKDEARNVELNQQTSQTTSVSSSLVHSEENSRSNTPHSIASINTATNDAAAYYDTAVSVPDTVDNIPKLPPRMRVAPIIPSYDQFHHFSKYERTVGCMVQPDRIRYEINHFNNLSATEFASKIGLATHIVELLKVNLSRFDNSVAVVLPYGSRVYGLAEPSSDLNVLIHFQNSNHAYNMQLIKQVLTTNLEDVFTNRGEDELTVYAIHKSSLLKCSFGVMPTYCATSSHILDNFMTMQPMCRFLLIYLQNWQKSLVRINDTWKFHFNNYTWSLLVVALFQIRQKLPAVFNHTNFNSISMPSQDPILKFNAKLDSSKIMENILDFFNFYGEFYKPNALVISAHTGQYQSRTLLTNTQREFTAAEACLVDGMRLNPGMWTDAAMCVQDIFQPTINVTVGITEKEVATFQMCCQVFAHVIRKQMSSK